MKLTDIKKLKVAELRTRLKEVNLDSRGLKAELVDRLWSALVAGQNQQDGEEKTQLQGEYSPTAFTTTEAVCEEVSSSFPPTEREVGAPCEPEDSRRKFTDSSTQTDTDTQTRQQKHGPESVSESVSEEREGNDPGDDERSQAYEEKGRGRAFYEFKEEIRYKRAKSPQPPMDREDAEEKDEDEVKLDSYDSHLHFEVGSDGACGQPRFCKQFPLLWSGCRLTHGVLQGKVGFEARLEQRLCSSEVEKPTDMDSYGLRVGWSISNSSLLLGEDEDSFAYDWQGRKVSGGKEEDFGEPFSEGDIIGCYASFSTHGAVDLSFCKNGRFMGVAFSLSASRLSDRALFPHILCKSCSVRIHLDPTAPPWYSSPPGFTPLAALSTGQRVRKTLASTVREPREVLLMVGLPGSGKTCWARTHIKQHPEKQYRLLGTEELLACMISGGQKERRLQQASQCLTELIKVAADTPGNYILDQCNILFSARRYKLQLFTRFRRTVVVVFPSAEEWKRRLSQHQMSDGEQIPETSLLKLQVSCSLPELQNDLLEELLYVELPPEQAQTLLQEYKDEARRLLPPVPKQEKKKPRLHKKRPYCPGPPHSRRIQWPGCSGWSDMHMKTWRQQPTYWDVTYQDQSFYYRDFSNSGYKGY